MNNIKLGMVGVAAVAALAGCTAPAAESEGQTGSHEESAVQAEGFGSGHYGMLDVVVRGSAVSGHYRDTIGDGETTDVVRCEFSFQGTVTGDGSSASIVAEDGWAATPGQLSVVSPFDGSDIRSTQLKISLRDMPAGCDRVDPDLAGADGVTVRGSAEMESDVVGYRTVTAARAYFYSSATATKPRSTYVLTGDSVEQIAAESHDMIRVRYRGASTVTTGYLRVADVTRSTEE